MINKNHMVRHWFVILSLAALCGCVDSVNTVENAEKTMSPEFMKNKRVVTDGFLRDRLEILRVDKAETPNGLLKFQVTMRSTRVGTWDWLVGGSDPYKIAYRIVWYDEQGMVVDTAASTWIQKDILPGDTETIQGVAPNQRCKDFLLKLRELPD